MPDPITTKPVAPRAAGGGGGSLTLEIVGGPGTGKRFGELVGRCSIGTHPSNTVVLEDPTVSRFHCELVVVDGDAVRIVDRKSLNGTRVDHVQVEQAIISGSERLYLGETVLRVALATATQPKPAAPELTAFGSLVGEAPAMRELFRALREAAASDATILLEGETGTGKEGAAEGIHVASARADGPFVPVDCSAIPSSLVESHLFGHEAGAFTGATAARKGAFEEADGGTLFLDEIGELPLDQQPKLLRALETRTIRRVGSSRPIKIDVRIIAATHRDLRAEVNVSRFRPDLFYRLAVIPIRIPPLRERLDDLPLLVGNFLDRLRARPEARRTINDPEFLQALARAPWPGNVRELRNHIERCLVFHEARLPTVAAAPPPSAIVPYEEARRRALEAFERGYVADVLARSGDSVAAAAKAAGIHRGYLYRLIERYQLRK
jgi:two-component system, NtrC family, response regulator GlrR